MAIIDELISRLGFELDGKEDLREFKRGMNDAEKGAKGFASSVTQMARNVTMGIGASIAAVKGLTAGMFAMANAATGPLDELVKAADRAGVSVEALQELGFAAEQSGASVGEMTSAVEMMSRRLAEAARGQGRAKTALEAYGLSATDAGGNVKSATDFMSELADTFQDLSEAERLDLGQQLGLSRGLITMLAQGNEEIDRLRQTARDAGLIFTDEDARNAEAYNDAMNLLMRSVRAMRDRIAIDLLPTLMQMIGGMQDWFMANRQVIQQNIGAMFERFARHSQTLTEAFRELPEAGWKVYAVLAALTRILFPKLFILGLVAGVVDDFLTYLEGGESIIGAFVDGLQDMLGVSEGLAQAMTGVVAALAALAIIKPGAFLRMVGGMGRLVLAVAGLKGIGAGAVLAGVGTGMAGIAAVSAGKLLLVVGAMWGLYRAAEAISNVPFDWIDRMLGLDPARLDKVDTSTGAIVDRITDRIRASAPKPRARSDQAAAPEELPQYGRQTAAESISVPLSSMGSNHQRFQPQSLGMQSPDSFSDRFGTGPMAGDIDQSTHVEVGGITVTVPPGADGRAIGQEAADALRRALSIHGASPVTP